LRPFLPLDRAAGNSAIAPVTASSVIASQWVTRTGSDDRLREAIHCAVERKNGLLRRIRLRSMSYGGQVAPRNDGWSVFRHARKTKILLWDQRDLGRPVLFAKINRFSLYPNHF
jgi:hypothetical protein